MAKTSTKKPKRVFTLVRSSLGSIGRYKSTTPHGAAKKAATQLLRGRKKTDVKVTIKEVGTDRKFSYHIKHEKLATPVERVINGNVVKHLYKSSTKKIPHSW
jgi:hypothetical protein